MTKKELLKELVKYKKLSLTDHLTGLYNRRKLERDLKYLLNLQDRYYDHYTLIFIDIDKFKEYNDNKGHKEGDKLLQRVAKILREQLRQTDKIYRLGGDEFVAIVRELYTEDLRDRLKELFELSLIKVSIGYSLLEPDCLEKADTNMYKDKRRKK